MNQKILIGVGVAVVAILVLLSASLFTVHQGRQALVLQLGNPVRTIQQPGLNMKVPFLQQVEFFERRTLDFDAPTVELVLGDQKRLAVDTFARYRISDPLLFRQSSGNELNFRLRMEPIIFSALRSVLGEVSLFQVLSSDRNQLMARIRDEANRALTRFGVTIVDVRIKRADLPAENSQAVFRRMQTERQREAMELRAQGAEIGQRIRARADRERRVLVAEAQKTADVLRGEGDAEAISTFTAAASEHAEFFNFYRSMQAYRNALTDESTSYVLSPDNDFFRYFNHGQVGGGPNVTAPSAPAPAASNGLAGGTIVAEPKP